MSYPPSSPSDHQPLDHQDPSGNQSPGGSRTLWILGAVAFILVAALAVAIVYVTSRSNDTDSVAASATAASDTVTVTSVATEQAETTQSVQPTQATQPEPSVADTPEATTQDLPAGSQVVQSGPCLESEARSFGSAADGTSLVCIYTGAGSGYTWVQHAENDGSVHNIGDPCDSAVDKVAQDPSGKAIMCGGDTWVGGP